MASAGSSEHARAGFQPRRRRDIHATTASSAVSTRAGSVLGSPQAASAMGASGTLFTRGGCLTRRDETRSRDQRENRDRGAHVDGPLR